MTHDSASTTKPALPERFLAVVRPIRTDKDGKPREPKHKIENDAFVAMMWRLFRALEVRAIDDPQLLVHIEGIPVPGTNRRRDGLRQRLEEISNVVIAANADRFAVDPRSGLSMAECARVLEISKPAASERRSRGKATMLARLAFANVHRFSEAKRERDAIRDAAAAAEPHLQEYRGRHLRAVS